MLIEERYEQARGCGYREPGGLYLVADNPKHSCPALPLDLHRCPTCSGGIKPSRGWTWVDGNALFTGAERVDPCEEPLCPLNPMVREAYLRQCGLLWIGGQYYKSPNAFLNEATDMGISRRIPAIPKDFVLGETWVLLAHRQGRRLFGLPGEGEIDQPGQVLAPARWMPQVFSVFRPTAIEYVVREDDTEEALEALVKRGVTLVRVHKQEEETDEHDTAGDQ